MAVTLAGGLICTHIYQRRRNLYALGLAHGALGFLLYLVVPDSISHHLRVGWSWFG
jgi:membrane protease YdiL (CAAX protease family)